MSFYSLPKWSSITQFTTNFRPTIPFANSNKTLAGININPFTLVILENRQLKYCPKLAEKAENPTGTHLAVLYYQLDATGLEQKLTEYSSIDFCQDYLDTFGSKLISFTFINCYTNNDTVRVIELSDLHQLVKPNKDQQYDSKSLLKTSNMDTFIPVFLALLLALFADKRTFPYSYIWVGIDPYNPDWEFWSTVYTSFGFENPEIVTETPTGTALCNEVIALTRPNNFTGQSTVTKLSQVQAFRNALVKCLHTQATSVAIKWKGLGKALRDSQCSGALFYAMTPEHKYRVLKLNGISVHLLMWPQAIKSKAVIDGIGFPFYTTERVDSSDLCKLVNAVCKDYHQWVMVLTAEGISILQCGVDFTGFLKYLQKDSQKEPLVKYIYEFLKNLESVDTEKIRSLHFEDLFSTLQKSVDNSLKGFVEGISDEYRSKRRVALFRHSYTSWTTFEENGVIYTFLFGSGKCLEYTTAEIV